MVDNEPRPYVVTCSHRKPVVVCHCQLVSTPNLQHKGPPRKANRTSSTLGLDMIDGRDRYSLSYLKAKAHSSVHSNPFHLFIKRKKGLHLSADREINRFKTAVILVSFWISLGFRGGFKLLMALIWSGLTSCNLCFLRISKIFPRSPTCSNATMLFTTMSSI